MSKDSKIEWTDHTFNPWWGCVKVSPGCEHCYAEAFSKRTGHTVWGPTAERRFFGAKHWAEPHQWNEAAAKDGRRARVFCASMADVFEDRGDLFHERAKLYQLIADTPHLDWLLLTKRPENIIRLTIWSAPGCKPPPNVWFGTTVENQTQAEKRIPELLKVPASVHFLSCEPLLGPVTLAWDLTQRGEDGTPTKGIDWVIVGGESGPKARPMHPDWARALRDECVGLGVPFFFKQWGEWIPAGQISNIAGSLPKSTKYHDFGNWISARVGKHNAGRMLDGRTWDEVPQVNYA